MAYPIRRMARLAEYHDQKILEVSVDIDDPGNFSAAIRHMIESYQQPTVVYGVQSRSPGVRQDMAGAARN